jgi:RNA polymerase sigma-70 factor, ECF subfamily
MPSSQSPESMANGGGPGACSSRSLGIDASTQLIESCRRYLLLVANRELDGDLRAKVGPSDLVQDTLLEAQRELGKFQGDDEADMRAWLRRILLHNVANIRVRYRASKKRDVGREISIDGDPHGVAGNRLVSVEPSPSNCVAAQELNDDLARAVSSLPDHYREAIRLRHQENCSFEEMGRRMGRSAEAARKVWARGVEQLREHLKSSHEPG